MPRLDASEWRQSTYRDNAYRLVDLGVGGFGVFCGTLKETAMMLEDLQRRSGNRLLFGADYEYGLPMRLTEGGIAMPRAMALGRGSEQDTEKIAAAVAREMRALGVHWNWAPVADVNSEPANPIVNTRAFDETVDIASKHVAAWVRGTQAENIAATVKHAPGHGATTTDSHLDLPTIQVSAERAARREFVPFRAGIEAGAQAVMMGHLLVPFLDKKYPASMSIATIGGLVRQTWEFGGVVVTDALDMGAITKHYTSAAAVTRSFKAGADICLMPEDPFQAITALQTLVTKGTIAESRIVASEARIAVLRDLRKKWPRQTRIDQSAHAELALQSAKAAISIHGNTNLLPITQYNHAAVFGWVTEADADLATQWFRFLAQATEMNVDFGYINSEITQHDVEQLTQGIADADVLVVAVFGSARAFQGTLPSTHNIVRIVNQIAEQRPVIFVLCGSPYGIQIPYSMLSLNTYSNTTPSLAASVLRLIGKE